MSRLSRTKGATFERLLAARWRELGLYPEARRGIGQARSGGEVCDVEGTPWWVEAKHRKAVSVPAALKQAGEASDAAFTGAEWRPPVVIAREHGQRLEHALAVMWRSDALDLLGWPVGLGDVREVRSWRGGQRIEAEAVLDAGRPVLVREWAAVAWRLPAWERAVRMSREESAE